MSAVFPFPEPEGATPPEPVETWRWHNGLTLAHPQRAPQVPTLIEAGRLSRFDRLDDLARALADRLGGRTAMLRRCVATYADLDTFPAYLVYADGAQDYVGCAAVQTTSAEQLLAAIAAAATQPAGRT